VGERLALIPRAREYGEKSLVYAGPMYESMTITGNKISLTFGDIGGGLVTNDSKAPTSFAIAGTDKKWYWATSATIQGNVINLTCSNVSVPKYVRYAYASNPITNLYNKEGLPACPFTTEGNQLPVTAVNYRVVANSNTMSNSESHLNYRVNFLGQAVKNTGLTSLQVLFQKQTSLGRGLIQLKKRL
jgi:hypothetical protein